ncbi:unnamed protein product, partial [Timema podura]|nr:unnamed protein product [Timema podura]
MMRRRSYIMRLPRSPRGLAKPGNEQGRGDPCHRVEIPNNAECGASLTCSEKSGTCVPLSLGAPFPSMKPLGPKRPIPCLASNSTLWQRDHKCSPDGSYAPKQCNAKFCMCVTRHGEVLPYSQPHKMASNMEC